MKGVHKLLVLAILFTSFSFGQNSLFLPGAVNYVDVGDLNVTGDQLTVEALIHYTGNSINVVSKHSNPADVNYLLRIGSFEITTTQGFANFGGVAAAGVTLVQDETYHIAATYNGAYLRYYINGCLTGEMEWSGDMVQNNLSTAIGQQSLSQNEQFVGYIDEVRIWNVARTQQEIAENMLDLPNPTAQVGLQAYYKFNGNFENLQGNAAFNGTPVGSPEFDQIPGPYPFELHVSANYSDPLCSNENNGTIDAFGSGAYEPLEYSIDGTNYFSQSTFTDLPSGNYTVTVRPENNNECISTTNVVINNPDEILPNFDITDVDCNGNENGEVVVSPSGGNGPNYTVEFLPQNIFDTSMTDLSPDNYEVSITDSCKSFGEELIENGYFEDGFTGFTTDYAQVPPYKIFTPDDIAVTHNAALHGAYSGVGFNNGGNFLAIDASVDPNFNIWCQTINVNPNSYYNFSFAIAEIFGVNPVEIEIEFNGIAHGGTFSAPPTTNQWDVHEFSWFSDNNTTVDICIKAVNPIANGNDFGLDAISLKECLSCEAIFPYEITEPDELVLSIDSQDESCGGAQDGMIEINVLGGNPNYEYSIDNGNSSSPSNVFQSLSGGNYDILVTDQNNCTISDEVQLDLLPPLNFDFNFQDPLCHNSNDGNIEFINFQGGSGNYEFSIDNGVNFTTDELFTNLPASNYSLVLRDDNNCQIQEELELNNPNPLILITESDDAICNNESNGSLTIAQATGGTGNLNVLVNNSPISGNQENNLSAGNYLVELIDENNCSLDTTVVINEPSAINFDAQIIHLNCHDSNDGSINFQDVSGGNGNYSYSIDGGDNIQSSPNFTNLSAGTYELYLMDINECSNSENVELTAPNEIMLNATIEDETCFNDCDGSIAVSVNGGVEPFEIIWGEGSTSFNLNSLCHGDYAAQIIDDNGCEASMVFTIERPEMVVADFSFWEDDYSIINSTIDFTNESEGASTYIWTFDNGEGFSNAVNPSYTFPDEPGDYDVQLIALNENECADTVSTFITINDEVIFYVPNTFTPDGDGFNETFEPVFTSGYDPQEYNLLIFNRWGEIVFESNNANVGWDGTYGGRMAPDGIYTWKIKFKQPLIDKRFLEKGHVTLIR